MRERRKYEEIEMNNPNYSQIKGVLVQYAIQVYYNIFSLLWFEDKGVCGDHSAFIYFKTSKKLTLKYNLVQNFVRSSPVCLHVKRIAKITFHVAWQLGNPGPLEILFNEERNVVIVSPLAVTQRIAWCARINSYRVVIISYRILCHCGAICTS